MLYEKSKAKAIIADKDKLQEIVSKTLNDMAAIVGATLGPGGRGVLIERDGLAPLVTKDGVTVARSLGVDKAEANVVIEAAKEICINTAKEAGDGTTTAIVLADAISRYGHQFIKNNPKYNPQRLVSELQEAYDDVMMPFLKKVAMPVNSEEQLAQVATISANGDKKIADVVVKAFMAAGDDGTVLIEEGQGDTMRMEKMDGYIVTSGLKDLGSIGPVFINDKGNQQVKMDNGIIFLYDGSMNDLKIPAMMQDALEGTELLGSPIIVFAHDFSDVVLDKFAKTAKGGITVVPVKTPMSGLPNSRSIFLQDMAAYTSGKVYDPGNTESLEDDETDGFGRFDTARVNMYESFISSVADVDIINNRVMELKSIAEASFSPMDKMHIKAAIGKLTGGVSTIYVGGTSELEVREKKHRVEDAVEAVRSAAAEGIVPGGCAVQLTLAHLLMHSKDYKPSWKIMIDALYEPFNLLITNCGEDPKAVLNLIGATKAWEKAEVLPTMVFDANQHIMVNAYEAGIIEPAKVCRVSIGNALSVASLLMTLGGIVVVPRDSQLENQLAMSKQAFQDMMKAGMEG